MFDSAPVPLDVGHPEWGKVFVVPWDTEIFGFPVGAYEPGDPGAIGARTIAVATGGYTVDELRPLRPWRIFETLPEPVAFARLIDGNDQHTGDVADPGTQVRA